MHSDWVLLFSPSLVRMRLEFGLPYTFSYSPCPNNTQLQTPLRFFRSLLSEQYSLSDSLMLFPTPPVRTTLTFGLPHAFSGSPCPNNTCLRTPLCFFRLHLSEQHSPPDSLTLFLAPPVRTIPAFGLPHAFSDSTCPNNTHFRTPSRFSDSTCPNNTCLRTPSCFFRLHLSEQYPLSDPFTLFSPSPVRTTLTFGLPYTFSYSPCPNNTRKSTCYSFFFVILFLLLYLNSKGD